MPEDLIRSYIEEATPVLRESLPPQRCIRGTRICLDIMEIFKAKARPVSVETVAMNAAATECVKAQDIDDTVIASSFSSAPLTTPFPPTGFRVGHGGKKTTPDGWTGHLVAIVDEKWLVDSALLQVNLPDFGIVVPDMLAFPVGPSFLRGHVALAADLPLGGQVVYQVRPDKTYKHKPDFSRDWGNQFLVRKIAARMNRP